MQLWLLDRLPHTPANNSPHKSTIKSMQLMNFETHKSKCNHSVMLSMEQHVKMLQTPRLDNLRVLPCSKHVKSVQTFPNSSVSLHQLFECHTHSNFNMHVNMYELIQIVLCTIMLINS